MDERKPERARPIGATAMKAFAHPLRMAMYDLLSQRGSATATTLAAELGESTGQTSYHLRQLERHGFVVEDPERGTGRERWWKPVGFSMLGYEIAKDSATRPQLELMLRTQLEEQVRDKTRWWEASDQEPPEWVAASLHDRTTLTMTAAELTALQVELLEVMHRHYEAVAGRGDVEGARRVRLYLDLLPLPQ